MGYGGGWVKMGRSVVGGFGLWVMVVGESVAVGGRLVGESVVVPISVLICFCLCFSVLVVDSAAVDFGGCGFFFSW